MGTTTMIWTPLPRRVVAGPLFITLELSVFVSPRLAPATRGGSTLSAFTAFTSPWPSTVAALSPTVSLLDPTSLTGDTFAARITNGGEGALDPALWSLLFPQTTPVLPFDYTRFSDDNVHSYAVGPVLAFMKNLFGGLAVSDPRGPHRLADQDLIYGAIGRIRRFANEAPTATPQQVVDRIVADRPELVDGTPTQQHRPLLEAFVALYQFFARNRGRSIDGRTPEPVEPLDPDFHQMVALLGDAPILLRRLGLIVDLEVDLPLDQLPSEGLLRVSASPREVIVERPLTWFEARPPSHPRGGWFAAKPYAAGDIVDGHLDLRRDDVHLYQMDVDGAALKLLDHAANVYQHSEAFVDRFNRPPDEVSTLPSAVSAGLAVARDGRASRVQDGWYVQDAVDAEVGGGDLTQVPLYAEDVLRGYRVDAYDGARWRTLCARRVDYLAAGSTALGPFSDEGYVKGASMTHDLNVPALHYLHERMFEWGGWSLVAGRPGLVFDPEEQLADVPNTPTTALDLETHTVPEPGSLPRLRFGTTYELKARTVDLAGHSVDLHQARGEQAATYPLTYRRYEPLPQPVLVYRDPITEGEWIENLVIRSDRDVSVADYAAANDYNETCERHVAPPKAHLFLCEQHGAFDARWAEAGAGAAHSQTYAIAVKEAGTFLDDRVWRSDLQAYEPVTVEFWAHPATPIADPRAQRGDPLENGQYVTHPDALAVLPYVPDPAALGPC